MNIILVNHYAGSPTMGMEFRPYYMAREWKSMGHNVLIVCASNAHVRNYQFDFIENHQEQNIEGIDYFIIKTPAYSGNGMDRIKNMMAFLKGLKNNLKLITAKLKPDVVIASSTYPLDIYPCRKLAKLSDAKLVYEVHDLWPLSPMELGGYSKLHPFIFIMQRAENYAYKHCDTVVSMLPKAFEHMKDHGLTENKFNYVPNGIVVEEWNTNLEIPKEFSDLINSEKLKGHKLIGYAGSHGVANALDSLIKGMKLVQNEPVTLLLIGDGPLKKDLIKLVDEEKLKNVHFLPSINKNLIPAVLDKLDILYLGLQNQSLFRFGISPNKLIDYLMAGKPIIQAINAGNDIVSDAKCGISIEPENPQKIADAIIELANLPESEIKRLGQNGQKFVLENHDYKILAKRFIEIFSL
jgi:glycosyltransferase involved in cell wall biosynthesis